MTSTKTVSAIVIVVVVAIALIVLLYPRTGTQPTTTPLGGVTTTTTPATSPTVSSPATVTATQPEKTISLTVGVLVDETGATSDVGVDYARGVVAALNYFNSKGIYTRDGVRVVLKYEKRDYAYDPTRAVEFYKEFRDRYQVAAIIGWGTADTERLADEVAKDRIVYISASYSAVLVGKPYNFFPAPDYSTQACIAVNWMLQQGAKKLALLYDNRIAYSTAPIPAIKAYAQKNNVTVVDIQLPLRAAGPDAENAILQVADSKADFMWCGNTIASCSLAAKSAATHGLNSIMVTNVWGFDARFPQMAGTGVAGRVAGVSPWIWPEYAGDKPGYRELYEAARMANIEPSKVNVRFMQGFINVWLLVKAIERTSSTELLEKKGEALKEALESSCTGEPIRLGEITPPMRFCPGNHLPFKSGYIVFYNEKGEFQFLGPISAPENFDCVAATVQQQK